MAFEHLGGQIMTDSNGTNYIISDYFSVIYPGESHPEVYLWKDIDSARIDDSGIAIHAGGKTYRIPANSFETRAQFNAAKTILLSAAAATDIPCDMPRDILPDKRLYTSCDIPSNAVFAKGDYNPKELKSSMLSMVTGKVGRLLWCVGILAFAAAIVLFQLLIGFAEDNWWYLGMGGFFCGVGAVVLAYLVMLTVSHLKYSPLIKSCMDHPGMLTFAVCPLGISVIEESVYSPHELIRFGMNDSYTETASMFIVMRKNTPLAWIPKSLFDGGTQARIEQYLELGTGDK